MHVGTGIEYGCMLLVMEFTAEALKQHSENFLHISDNTVVVQRNEGHNCIGDFIRSKATEEANIDIGLGQSSCLVLFLFILFIKVAY